VAYQKKKKKSPTSTVKAGDGENRTRFKRQGGRKAKKQTEFASTEGSSKEFEELLKSGDPYENEGLRKVGRDGGKGSPTSITDMMKIPGLKKKDKACLKVIAGRTTLFRPAGVEVS